MVSVTRSQTRLNRDCVRRRLFRHYSDIVTEKMIDIAIRQRRRHLARRGLVEDNAFAARWLSDVAVPTERALASGLAPNTIDSMNSVIRAVRSVVYDRCLMVGGYPTFLLEKTTKFSDVDFVLIVDAQVDYYSFYIYFTRLVEEQLDPDKNWQFEVYYHLLFPYCVRIGDVPLSDKSYISFVTKGTKTKKMEDYPDMQVVKLKADGVNVADFCFFVQRTALKQTLSKESVVDSLLRVGEGYDYERAINKINDSYDTCFVMNLARFDGPDGGLHCCDVSDENDVDKVDKRCLPVFKKGSEASKSRRLKYRERVSKSFKRHVKELRGLAM
nr:MAG: hypothetical protein [Hemigrapsus takanoi nimavirus]